MRSPSDPREKIDAFCDCRVQSETCMPFPISCRGNLDFPVPSGFSEKGGDIV
jgi:hypothetical protein